MRSLFAVALVFISTLLYAQDKVVQSNALPFRYTVEAAPEWTRLFERTSGWFGADGIFSIPLNGNDLVQGKKDTTLLLFSDTYIGEVKDGKPQPGNTMVNNTVAYVTGREPDASHIHFHYKQAKDGKPETFFVPQTSTLAKPQLFWLGDGFVNKEKDNTLYIFGYKVERTGEGVFDFIEPGVSIIAVPNGSQPPFEKQRQMETPLHLQHPKLGEGNLGAGILVNTSWAGATAPDGYVYVYGSIGMDKNLVAARVQPKDFEDFGQWRFWDGTGWNTDKNALHPITTAASNELSVTPLPNGKYLLIFQVMGLSDKVGMRIGDSPVGPFSDITEIWTAPEWKKGLWTYNAKAHPALSKPGELLISYNTITADFWNDIQKNADIYHPRFIRLKYEMK